MPAARACHDKFESRTRFQAAGLPVPDFFRASLSDDPEVLAARTVNSKGALRGKITELLIT